MEPASWRVNREGNDEGDTMNFQGTKRPLYTYITDD